MSGLIDISKVRDEVSEYCGTDVELVVSTNDNQENCFSFEWHSSQGVHDLKYRISNFEIKMISLDINDVVIGFFKSKVMKVIKAI